MLINKGETLFLQGDMGDLYHLKTGLLKVIRTQSNGDCVLLNLLVPGEIFPHHSLISPKEYHGTVIALLPSEVERIPIHDWYQSLIDKPEKNKEVAAILQDNLRKMQKRIEMTTLPSKKRIPFFRDWISMYGKNYEMEEILTQEEIGQFLGMSRETVNRHMRRES